MEFLKVVSFVLPIFLAIYIAHKFKVLGIKFFFLIILPTLLAGIGITGAMIVQNIFLGDGNFHLEMLNMLFLYAFFGLIVMLPALFIYSAVLLSLEIFFHLNSKLQLFFLGAIVGCLSGLWYGFFIVPNIGNDLLNSLLLPTVTGALSIVILNFFYTKKGKIKT